MFSFDPPENIRKPNDFWRFQGDQKRIMERKGLICWAGDVLYKGETKIHSLLIVSEFVSID